MFSKHHRFFVARFTIVLLLVFGMVGVNPARPVHAVTLLITNTNDSGSGSLRQAIANASSGDVITFHSSLAGKTITLSSPLVIEKDLTIDGSSLASKIRISGNNQVTVFMIVSPAAVTMDSLVITKGYSPEDAGGIYNDGILSLLHSEVTGNSGPSGAGIRNGGTVNLMNSNITANIGKFGGGVDNRGILNITNSTVSGNTGDQGGGIMSSYGDITVENSTFSNNRSIVTAGGAIQNDAGTLHIADSTFSNNMAATEGGAVFNNFAIAMDVANSTFFGNSALFGGGIGNVGSTLNITDSSFVENSSGDDLGSGGGAGIYNSAGSTLDVTNTTFSNNTTTGSGGGIANGSGSSAALDHVTLLGNKADSGAAISTGGNMTVTSSELTANVASSSAGGIYLSGSLDIRDSTFSNNSAVGDAGGLFSYSGILVLTNVTFIGNSSKTGTGGGLVNYLNSNPVLDHVIFENNSAVSGGGISNVNSSLTLTNGKFIHNSANKGGGMYSLGTSDPKLTGVTFHGNTASTEGGGLYNDEGSTPSLTNVTFHNNSAASKGGGVYNFIGSHPSLIHVTLSGNTAAQGGGLYNDLQSNSTLTNSIVWGNSGGEITSFMSTPVVRYSIVQGGYPGTGNLDQDPLLGPLQDNGGFTQTMALLPGSPAINTGTDESCPVVDQRGAGRPQGPHCDRGAYEYAPALPTTLTVTKTADTNDGLCNTDCSLREAILNSYNGDTIKFAVSGSIVLASDLPLINKTLVVDGTGQVLKLDGGGNHRIFKIAEPGDLTLKNMTLQNGHSSTPCMEDISHSCGGAIYDDGSLSTANVTFSGNTADMGGAIFIGLGAANIESSTFTDNSVTRVGGGILNWIGVLEVVNSTFHANSAAWDGGGVYNDINTLSLKNNTFSENSAMRGAAVYNSAGEMTLANNILANSTSGSDCFNEDPYAVISSNFHNLIETNAASPNNCRVPAFSADPKLGPLADHGGFTQTMSLLQDSPAIDAGGDGSCPPVDQRGVTRPQGSHCDIGAYEYTGNHGADTVGVFRPSNGLLYLKNQNTSGFADLALNYGLAGDYPVVGDWDGDGDDTIGVYRGNTFLLRNSNTVGFADINIVFGQSGDQPIAGDWDGDGDDTIGIFRPSTGQFLLRNSNTPGPAEISFYLGNTGDVGIAGDWDGDGIDTTGVFRPSNGIIFLKNKNQTGYADVALNYGLAGDKPVVGDWDNDGDTTIGIYRNGKFFLRNSNTNGFANIILDLGIPGDMPIAGNWDGKP